MMKNKKEEFVGKGIKFRCILEILGGPKEHIENTLRDYVKALKAWDTIYVTKSDYAEPEPQEKLFSMFVELEIWTKSIPDLIGFCLEAMPSNVEILEPSEFTIDSGEFAESLNDLQAKLHTVDMRIKDLSAKNTLLEKNATALATNVILVGLRIDDLTVEGIASIVGIPSDKVKPLLDHLIKEGRIKESDGTYSLVKS